MLYKCYINYCKNVFPNYFKLLQNVFQTIANYCKLLRTVAKIYFQTIANFILNLCKLLRTISNHCKLLQKCISNYCKLLQNVFQTIANYCKLLRTIAKISSGRALQDVLIRALEVVVQAQNKKNQVQVESTVCALRFKG